MEDHLISVYKISSDLIDDTYYGYCVEHKDLLFEFLKDAKRKSNTHIKRGPLNWFHKNQFREDNIVVEVVDGCDDEYEAWTSRNDYRSLDPHSITGPSNWPNTHFRTASNHAPEKLEGWKTLQDLKKCTTARQAYAKLKVFTFKDIKRLSEQFGKEVIVADLDSIDPYTFSEKYDLQITI